MAPGTNGPGSYLDLSTGSQYWQGADEPWAKLRLDLPSGWLTKPVREPGSCSLSTASQNAETPRFAAEGLFARQLREETGEHTSNPPPQGKGLGVFI